MLSRWRLLARIRRGDAGGVAVALGLTGCSVFFGLDGISGSVEGAGPDASMDGTSMGVDDGSVDAVAEAAEAGVEAGVEAGDAGEGRDAADAMAIAVVEAGEGGQPSCGGCPCAPAGAAVGSINVVPEAVQTAANEYDLTGGQQEEWGGVYQSAPALSARFYVAFDFSMLHGSTDPTSPGDGIAFEVGRVDAGQLRYPGGGALLPQRHPHRRRRRRPDLRPRPRERAGHHGRHAGRDLRAGVGERALARPRAPSTPVQNVADTVPDGSWHHVEVTVDTSSSFRMRATLDGTQTVSMKSPIAVPATGYLVWGAASGQSSARFSLRNLDVYALTGPCP